jgi:hypothetical protein
MAIVSLTLTISLCLVFTFIVFFLREHARGRLSSAERDSLLPLADEIPALAVRPQRDDRTACGGQNGPRPAGDVGVRLTERA